MDEVLPDFNRFDHDDAWRLGVLLVERCRSGDLPVVISIHLGRQRVFQAGLPGSSAMNDAWADRKRNTVQHFDRSSLAVWDRYAKDFPEFMTVFGLDPTQHAAGEGAVPIRVRGTTVGVLSLSGIEPIGDHDVVTEALQAYRTLQDQS